MGLEAEIQVKSLGGDVRTFVRNGPPLCSIGHWPFGAAAQKNIKKLTIPPLLLPSTTSGFRPRGGTAALRLQPQPRGSNPTQPTILLIHITTSIIEHYYPKNDVNIEQGRIHEPKSRAGGQGQ